MQSADSEEGKNREKAWKDWLKAGLVVIFAVILYRAVQSFGWIGGFDVRDKELTLGISFLVGIAASLSSCLAVVGGMVIAFSEKYQSGENNFLAGALWPNVKFHIGRIVAFFILGGLLGLIGGEINLGGNFVSVYTILIAVIMGWLGLSILGFAPAPSLFGIRTPKFLVRYWGRIEDSEHRAAPYFLGGITFFLPCGFTQSMQIFALASGSFWSGASILSVFALGTMPVLLALGVGASWGKYKKFTALQKAAGILVLIFAVYTSNSGLALWGTKSNVAGNLPVPEKEIDNNVSNSPVGGTNQKIEMKITSRGFEPSVLKVRNNIPVKFSINGDGATGCTNKIVIPDLGIAKDIKKGENTIEFTPKKLGAISFSCGMGMVRGKFLVE